ncbi:DUF1566 domain-containing protein [Acidobacteriota bacterium]
MQKIKWAVPLLLSLGSILFVTACGQSGSAGVESVTLRSESAELDKAALLEECKAKSLYVPGEKIKGLLSLKNRFEPAVLMEQKVVNDHATGLMWQQDEDATRFTWKEAGAYVAKMNAEKFAGYDNWRMPTAAELASLLSPAKKGDYFIDPVFHKELLSTWSVDQVKDMTLSAWFIDFSEGRPFDGNRAAGLGHVRLVRER